MYLTARHNAWLSVLQVAPLYRDLDQRCYEELEARVEETVRDALYGASKCFLGNSSSVWQPIP